jgi:nodulation protein E
MTWPRIAITGMGGLCGLGTNVPSIWEAMRLGRSGIGEITTVPLHELKIRIGAEIKKLPDHGIDRRRLITMDRFSLLAVIAADEAIRQAGLTINGGNTSRVGAIVGTGIFGGETTEENYRSLLVEKKPRAGVFTVPRVMPGAPAGQVSMVHGLRGPVFGVTSACSSSNHALASAADQLRLGRADIMLAGGTDAPLVYGVLKGWEALRALARETCRPFSADRDGLVIGEGAGIAVLETWEHATQRGATILAELAGAGLSGDATDIVAPTVEGPVAAMRACLADAGLAPEEVDYINAHGTGTKANDQIETTAIRRVFGKHADRLSVSSTKSMHAHCMGASGAIEMIACVMAIRDGIVPPTANYREKDPDCDLDVTPNVAKVRPVRAAISNGFAFGGTNSTIAFKAA